MAFLGGCSGGGETAKCVPGLTVDCPCPAGQQGAQTCNSAGTFAACACTAPTVDAAGTGSTDGAATSPSDAAGAGGSGASASTGGAGNIGGGGGAGGIGGGTSGGTSVDGPTSSGGPGDAAVPDAPGLQPDVPVDGVGGGVGTDGSPDMVGPSAGGSTGVGADGSSGDGGGSGAGGITCQSGQCTCPPGLSVCSGTCVDEQTDNGNCGGCGTVCSAILPSTAACTVGRCLVTVASGLSSPAFIALDATSIYWTDYLGGTGGTVMKVPIGGGIPTALALGQAHPEGLAVDAASVYWANDGP